VFRLHGRLDVDDLRAIIRSPQFRLLVDADHALASEHYTHEFRVVARGAEILLQHVPRAVVERAILEVDGGHRGQRVLKVLLDTGRPTEHAQPVVALRGRTGRHVEEHLLRLDDAQAERRTVRLRGFHGLDQRRAQVDLAGRHVVVDLLVVLQSIAVELEIADEWRRMTQGEQMR
jgi:hypothetical protein